MDRKRESTVKSDEAIKTLLENIDVTSSMASYLAELLDQVAKALAIELKNDAKQKKRRNEDEQDQNP